MVLAATIEPSPQARRSDSLAATERQVSLWADARRARLRPRTLINLRWLGIAGQVALLIAAGFAARFPTPWAACLAVIGVSVALNVFLSLPPTRASAAVRSRPVLQLGFDLTQLAALLWLTGGLANPFCLMLIAPVTLAGATLRAREALGLGVLAAAFCLLLAFSYAPLPWGPGGPPVLPTSYRLAVAAAVITGIVFTAGYAWQAANEARRIELALHVAETVLAREQRLSALGALAAAAAHELGTPLSTIAVVARELANGAPAGPLRDDANLLVSQSQRCRDILPRLTQSPETRDPVQDRIGLAELVFDVIEPYARETVIQVQALVTGPPYLTPPTLWRRPEIVHALATLVENAFDFAHSKVLVTAGFDAHNITLEIRDDGPGFAPEILPHLGEPYITSRPAAEGSRTGHIGMGLGIFIAKTLLEQTGAHVTFANDPRGGAVITGQWQRAQLEAPSLMEGMDLHSDNHAT